MGTKDTHLLLRELHEAGRTLTRHYGTLMGHPETDDVNWIGHRAAQNLQLQHAILPPRHAAQLPMEDLTADIYGTETQTSLVKEDFLMPLGRLVGLLHRHAASADPDAGRQSPARRSFDIINGLDPDGCELLAAHSRQLKETAVSEYATPSTIKALQGIIDSCYTIQSLLKQLGAGRNAGRESTPY